MLAFFYDFETTGLPLFKEPSEDPRQPHIVQAAGILVDLADKKIVASLDLTCKPDGWEIPDEVAAIHGITTAKAMECGISESLVVSALHEMSKAATVRVGHNESFDARIMRIALMRHSTAEVADQWKEGVAHCTASLSTEIVQCPPTEKMLAVGRKHFKKPTLTEAYKHFTGKDLENAHSAMADAVACMEIYFLITTKE
jgi:DNA polymerase-3 subunit epsilon